MRKKTVLIVGHGIVGAQIGHELQSRGHNVTWVDAGLGHAPSALSIGLIKDSWVSGLQVDVPHVLRRLDERYGLGRLEFPKLGVLHQLEGSRIQEYTPVSRVIRARVERLEQKRAEWVVHFQGGAVLLVDVVIVAAGWWSAGLTNAINGPVEAHYGEVFAFRQGTPTIRLWAPYRQLVLVRHSAGFWWGSDGLAVSKIKPAQSARTLAMLTKAGGKDLLWKRVGARPYTQDKGGVCQQVAPGQWVVTGGRKSSTVLAAGWAELIAEKL